MTGKIKGQPNSHKRFRVKRDVVGGDILASFDTIEEAISPHYARQVGECGLDG
jgi:hypothetical protein